MEQQRLLPSGVQVWAKHVVAARSSADPEEQGSNTLSSKIAYSSSLAVFVVDAATKNVSSVLAGYEGLITSLCWSPYDEKVLAASSEDGRVVLWNIDTETRANVLSINQAPVCMHWIPHKDMMLDHLFSRTTMAIATVRGSVIIWDAERKAHTILERVRVPTNLSQTELKKWKDDHKPTVIRCHLDAPGKCIRIACGFRSGKLRLFKVDVGAFGASERFCIDDLQGTTTHKEFTLGVQDKSDASAKPGHVADMQWDPCSPNYLLVAFAGQPGAIALLDCGGADIPVVVQRFKPPLKLGSLLSLAWQVWVPGNFVTISEKGAGLMQVWNVSQKEPVDTIRVSSGSSAVAFSNWGSLFVLPLENGAVCAFNAKRRLNLVETKPAHRETVFDVKFCPSDENTFASCSFDGKIKLWNTLSLECMKTLRQPDSSIVYCMSWCQQEARYLVSSTLKGNVSVWDTQDRKGKLVTEEQLHKAAVYRVEWNPNDPTQIASASGDGYLKISTFDLASGTLKQKLKFKHPDKVFGCSWNPHEAVHQKQAPCFQTLVGSGCQDGNVYLWDIPKGKHAFLLKGHSKKVFNVAWSPLIPGLIASGSDDLTVMIWRLPNSFETKTPVTIQPDMVLKGHTNNVRALLWSTELEDILLSGSWDGTVRVWNTRLGTCLSCTQDHHADVYGLAAHPNRPFQIVSSSRDTTIRFWNLVKPDAIQVALVNLVARVVFQGFVPTRSISTLLKGHASAELFESVERLLGSEPTSDDRIRALSSIMNFFSQRQGLADLWKYISAACCEMSKAESDEEVITRDCERLVQDFEQTAIVRPRLRSNESSAKAYVDALCKVGDFRTACEYLKEGNDWAQAIMMAPAVSVEYWKQLTEEYAKTIALQGSESAVTHLLAVGNTQAAVDHYQGRGDFDNALLLAQLDLEREGQKLKAQGETVEQTFRVPRKQSSNDQFQVLHKELRRNSVARARAERYLSRGEHLLAACSLLSIKDRNGALAVLLEGKEEVLALLLSYFFFPSNISEPILVAFIDKCESLGAQELALQLHRKLKNPSLQVALFCCRFNVPVNARVQLGLRQGEKYLKDAMEAEKRGEDIAIVIQHLCASGDLASQRQALEMGCKAILLELAKPTWSISKISSVLVPLQSLDLSAVLTPQDNHLQTTLLFISSLIGGYKAAWAGYLEVSLFLFESASALSKKNAEDMPISHAFVLDKCASTLVRILLLAEEKSHWSERVVSYIGLIDKEIRQLREGHDTVEEQLEQSLQESLDCLTDKSFATTQRWIPSFKLRPVLSIGCHALPNGNIRCGHRSFFTGRFIKGPVVKIANSSVALSVPEAVTWSRFSPYSPLNDGAKLFNVAFTSSLHVESSKPVLSASSSTTFTKLRTTMEEESTREELDEPHGKK